ncbi:ABC transporter ATP-binding protein [Propionicimonas sp.]|uniref:ABC transporter ATP-binding protein n=1 Tax=Propionicimonas sp. TaxID=1955623 RepID=UPI0017DA82AD|nr:ABC transporter ATP-binding protein [Propionicimonas sp.]MBU3976790.1 ABC transporter ATP-binding protein/permease [Actinomycetota bacterium]MBA3019479.1 ABC transporter ATP-binding protein [Propionicimonas sp.]MBU3986885.1 ABC transporter ATP-binding protein/permease [Actinomycetota bacterium]MBU4006797.1 ABC transporter ATP-binding protein/permease [Actinomycetota bacterium]MBU4065497.1 ABC transporter ATP-binding protein/permease [Actinomycetota bacterium]
MIRLLVRYLRPYSGYLAAILGLQLVQATAALFLPTLNASIIDDGVATGNTGYIWMIGAVMLGVSLLQIVGQIGATWFGASTAMAFGRDLRQAIFDRALSFSAREMNSFGAPTLITRNTNDVQQLQMLVLMTATMIISAPLMMIGGVVMALREDVGLSWLILVAVVVLGGIIGILIIQTMPLFKAQQTRIDNLNRVLRELLSGLRVIRAFVREPTESARFDAANHDLADTATRIGRRMMTMFPVVFFVMNLSSIAVIWFGAFRISSGDLQVGQLTAYLAYLTQILMSVVMSTMILMMAPRAAVGAERINQVLDTSSSVVPPTSPVTKLSRHGEVAFTGVSFAYPGAAHPVLDGISFTVRPGTTTAIIGSTGAGKTTLVNLIPRLVDATDGVVSVDGVDVRELDPDLLWGRIGLVPQRPYLFSGTVASNLKLGKPDASDDELWHALEVAQAADFVRRMPEALNSAISQGGTNVSGGQRQRLAIARALVRRPELYIFDDSFSALDVATDAALRAALAPETENAAVIVVAQRVSTIREATAIIVLDDGAIVGIGTHEELLETCPTYAEIVESQFKAEVAA